MELNQRIQRLEAERQSKQDLYDQIDSLQKQLSGEQTVPSSDGRIEVDS